MGYQQTGLPATCCRGMLDKEHLETWTGYVMKRRGLGICRVGRLPMAVTSLLSYVGMIIMIRLRARIVMRFMAHLGNVAIKLAWIPTVFGSC